MGFPTIFFLCLYKRLSAVHLRPECVSTAISIDLCDWFVCFVLSTRLVWHGRLTVLCYQNKFFPVVRSTFSIFLRQMDINSLCFRRQNCLAFRVVCSRSGTYTCVSERTHIHSAQSLACAAAAHECVMRKKRLFNMNWVLFYWSWSFVFWFEGKQHNKTNIL